jgi:hypothetical protein
MKQHKPIAIRELEAEEEDLLSQLARVRASLRALRGPGVTEVTQLPKTRADYLLRHLVKHPEGVRLKDVPRNLEGEGFISRAACQTVNWLYQLPAEKQYFVIEESIVKLRADLVECTENGIRGWTVPTQAPEPAVPATIGQPALSPSPLAPPPESERQSS